MSRSSWAWSVNMMMISPWSSPWGLSTPGISIRHCRDAKLFCAMTAWYDKQEAKVMPPNSSLRSKGAIRNLKEQLDFWENWNFKENWDSVQLKDLLTSCFPLALPLWSPWVSPRQDGLVAHLFPRPFPPPRAVLIQSSVPEKYLLSPSGSKPDLENNQRAQFLFLWRAD